MVAYAFNPALRRQDTGGSLPVQGQPSLLSEFQDSQGYVNTEVNIYSIKIFFKINTNFLLSTNRYYNTSTMDLKLL